MNTNNQQHIRGQIASRRFGKGIPCRIINDVPVIRLMAKYNILTANIAKVMSDHNGYDVKTGKVMVIPLADEKRYIDLFKSYTGMSGTTELFPGEATQVGSEEVEEVERRANLEALFIEFLQQTIIVTYVTLLNTGGEVLRGQKFDVVVETIDVSQAVVASPIRKSIIEYEEPKSWTSR